MDHISVTTIKPEVTVDKTFNAKIVYDLWDDGGTWDDGGLWDQFTLTETLPTPTLTVQKTNLKIS